MRTIAMLFVMMTAIVAQAMAAPPDVPDETAIAEKPAYEADTAAVAGEVPPRRIEGSLTPEQLASLKRAIAKAEAERVADDSARPATPMPEPWPFDRTYQPPVATPLPLATLSPYAEKGNGPVFDFDPDAARRSNLPAADTRITTEERLAELLPIAGALAGAGLAFALWRFLHARWRGYVPTARRIITGYWREIGLFTILAAIFVKLW